MTVERVAQLSLEHIAALLPRLERFGAHGLHTRALLSLLLRRVNRAPFEVLAAGGDASDAAVVTVTHQTPRRATLDVCARDDAASRRRLRELLRAPQLSTLWGTAALRARGVSSELAPVLAEVASEHGASVCLREPQRLFARHPSLPCLTGAVLRPGVAVRPLQQRHLAGLQQRHLAGLQQRHLDEQRRPADARLSAGVFLATGEPRPGWTREPVAWALLDAHGEMAFGGTEAADGEGAHRRLALAELTRLCQQLDLPCVTTAADSDREAFRDLFRLDFISAHAVMTADLAPQLADVQPAADSPEPETRAALRQAAA